MIRRLFLLRLVLGLVLVSTCLGACRSRLPWAQAPAPGTWRMEGTENLDREELTKAAWRELQAITTSEYPKAEAYDAAYAMERKLREEGYPDAMVDFEEVGGTMVFRVRAGQPTCMGKVYFKGVTQTPTSTFVPYFDFSSDGLLPKKTSPYSESKVATGVSRVVAWYHKRGYLDVEVGPVKNLPRGGGKTMDFLVPVNEGQTRYVRSITLKDDAPCLLDSSRYVGQTFTSDLTFAATAEVTEKLEEDGYLFSTVKSRAMKDETSRAVDIEVDVDRGEQQRLGRVVIEGARRTKTSFVRKQIKLRPGQILRRSDFNRSVQSVYQVALWKGLDAELRPTGPRTSDLVLKLEEADSRRIDYGLGWGSWELLRGQVQYRDFNFMGEGRYFEAGAILSIRHQGLTLRLEDPWILGDRNLLGVQVGVLRRTERFYKFWGIDARLYYERIMGNGWRFRGGYEFEAREAFDIDRTIPGARVQDIEGFSRSAGLFAALRWDRRDHLFVPTKGWLVEGRTFWSEPALGANLSYVEVTLLGSHFLNIADGTVLGSHLQFASKEILDGSPTLPIQERYFLGGGDTVRAFGQDQLTPIDRFGGGLGGLTSFMGTLELRQRIMGPLHAAIFYDIGMVAVPSFDLDGAWGQGPGVGVRFVTPLGPLRLDFAYNTGDLLAASSRYQFHFAFGFTF